MMRKNILLTILFLWMPLSKCFAIEASDVAVVNQLKKILIAELHFEQSTNNLQIIYIAHSPYTSHYTFQITHANIPIWSWKIKVNVANDGKILSIIKNIGLLADLDNLPIISNPIDTLFHSSNYSSTHNYSVYFQQNNNWQAATVLRQSRAGSDSLFIKNTDNQILQAYNCAMSLSNDTIIKTKIFLPDPLTFSKQTYLGIYVDANDANATWLSNAAQIKSVNAIYNIDSQKIFLENKFVKMVDFNLPFLPVVNQSSDSFFYNRNQNGFEDCNAFYHITNYHNYIASLGFGSLMNIKIHVDAHGQNGADNSVFTSFGINPTLDLGTGGVDDAEDADVVIHEYAHGISWSANGNTVIMPERVSLDEGVSDYFATSYSKGIDTFGWVNMFSWDGHNEFWDGRNANVSTQYTTPYALAKYTGGEVWNTAMMKIWDAIGQEATDKIMLQALYSFTDNSTFQDAAAYVLQADSIIYLGVHRTAICEAFRSKGIEPTGGCWPANVENNSLVSFSICNQLAFANHQGSLNILLPKAKKIKIQILNVLGQTIQNIYDSNTSAIFISSNHFLPGVYFLHIQADDHLYKTKFISY
jgi:zinc metalloprotease ZmpB